jgi:predicted 2-oxoglutarate/Fe(II)-dependent dioxygenase YbiX
MMSREDSYYRPGALVRIPGFMPADWCETLRSARQAGPAEPAGYMKGAETRYDGDIRRTNTIAAPDGLIDDCVEKLEAIQGELAGRFAETLGDMTLGDMEWPQVLAYGRGGHFSVHQDSGDDPALPAYVRERALSVVLFLNAPSAALRDGMYGGGTLTFFCMSPGASPRVPVVAEAGTLIVFPSRWHHCVTPVQHGMRWTLVTWIAGKPATAAQRAAASR